MDQKSRVVKRLAARHTPGRIYTKGEAPPLEGTFIHAARPRHSLL